MIYKINCVSLSIFLTSKMELIQLKLIKYVVFIVICIPSVLLGSNGIIGLGYVKDGVQFELSYQPTESHSIHLAYATNSFWDGSKGEEKGTQLWNYGKTVRGTGDGFCSFDIGYGYTISQVRLTAEISFIEEYQYTNYADARFKDGGYYMKHNEESKVGYGSTISYIMDSGFEIYIGYNSYKKMNAGLRFNFYNKW